MSSFDSIDPDIDINSYEDLATKLNLPLDDAYYIFKVVHDNDCSPLSKRPVLTTLEPEDTDNKKLYLITSSGWPLTPSYESLDRLCQHIKIKFDDYKSLVMPYKESKEISDEEYLDVIRNIFTPVNQTELENMYMVDTDPEKCFWYGT